MTQPNFQPKVWITLGIVAGVCERIDLINTIDDLVHV